MRGMLTVACLGLALACAAAGSGEEISAEVLLPGHEATDAHTPAMAFGKDVFLVVWRAGMGERADIVALRLDKAGKPLDARPFVISAAKDCQERPRAAFGGGVFLLVWQDLRNGKDWDVYAARVTPEGKVLDPEGIAVAADKRSQVNPALCFDGSAFQLVWRDLRGGVDYAVYGGRVTADGRLLDGPGGVLVQEPIQDIFTTVTGPPGIGSAGDGRAVAALHSRVLRAWGMAGGKATGKPAAALKAERESRRNNGWDPAFASDGKKLLMVFTTFRQISRGGIIGGSGAAILNPDGSGLPVEVIDMTGIEHGEGCAIRNPSPCWDGSTYVVAWDIERGERGKPAYDAVFLRRVSADGKPWGETVFVAGELASPAFHPAAASDGAGTTVIAYERGPKTGQEPIRIGVRTLKRQ
ncbi:MAG: hypothetical protein N3A38_06215 [Planctomycetota bacterium]|nr:hypothetical protein [Planctomycetota bacterium]